ncbi:MAG TPA: retropepsin-like aspartic protease [Verrucomicrobiae bacterium]
MKIILKFRALGITLSLVLLCSCATTFQQSAIVPATELPADATINKSAGRGDMLFVTLRLEDGQELSFGVDTGAEGTVFDKSLESKLGKRLGTKTLSGWHGKTESALYAAPNLYFGNVRLMTGNEVATGDFQRQSLMTGRPVMGILGMDCLKHYCIQLDFEAGKIRFLNSDQMDATTLGKDFPLTFKGNCPFIHHVSFAGGKDTHSLIDSGCVSDGFVEQGAVEGEKFETVHLQECVWSGESYSNLFVQGGANVIGLKFLARHLVTLDFPKQTMYLKRTSVGPLVDKNVETAMQFLKDLKEKGQLPGWSKGESGETAYPEANSSNSVTFNIGKKDDSSIYHYTIARTSKDNPWKLEKAWRTDQNGKTIEEYPVP